MGKTNFSSRVKLTARSCAFVLGMVLVMVGKTSMAAAPQFARHTIDTTICSNGGSSMDLAGLLGFSDADGAADTDTFSITSGPAAGSIPPTPSGVGALSFPPSYSVSGAATAPAAGVLLYTYPSGNHGIVTFTIRISDGTSFDQVTINVRMVIRPTAGITTPYVQIHNGATINFMATNFSDTMNTGSNFSSIWSASPSAHISVTSSGAVTATSVGTGDTVIYSLSNGVCALPWVSKSPLNVVTNIPPQVTVLPTPIDLTTSNGGTYTIAGTGFYGGITNYEVYFGGAKATVVNVTSTGITVNVPAGATYGALQVTDNTSQLVTLIANAFVPHHDNAGFIAATGTDVYNNAPISFSLPGVPGPYSVEYADLDADGDNDVLISGTGTNAIMVFANTPVYGRVTSLSFPSTPATFAVSAGPLSLKVADLDGDGKLDVSAVCVGAAQVSVLRNISTPGLINFAPRFDIQLPGALPSELTIADFNKDGRPDIAVAMTGANDTATFTGTGYVPTTSEKYGRFVIIQNNYNKNAQSIIAADFVTTTAFLYDSTSSPISIASGDLNADGFPDVAISVHHDRKVDMFRNTSVFGGNIQFSPTIANISTAAGSGVLAARIGRDAMPANDYNYSLYRTGYPEQVRIGDLDGDGKPDLAVAVTDSDLLQSNSYNAIKIAQNASSAGGPIVFGSSTTLNTNFATPVALAIGDLDGDGKLDIVASNSGALRISMFLHTVAAGFGYNAAVSKIIAISAAPVCPAIGDLDGNGIPDIAIASRSDNKLYIFRGYPRPDTTAVTGDSVICNGGDGHLHSNHNPAATGTWTVTANNHVTLTGTTTDTGVTVHGNTPGIDTVTFTVVLLGDTNRVKYVVRTSAIASAGTILANGIASLDSVCAGQNISLTSTNPGGTWSSATPASVTINTGTGLAGGVVGAGGTSSNITYSVAGCGTPVSKVFRVIAPPTAGGATGITAVSGISTICQGATDTLKIASGVTRGGTWHTRMAPGTSALSLAMSPTHDSVFVTGASAGSDTVIYLVTTPCGEDSSKFVVTVNNTGVTPVIASGPKDSVCTGSTIILNVNVAGGSWASTNSAVANVLSTTATTATIQGLGGVADTATITYTTTGCGAGTAKDTIYVAPQLQTLALTGRTRVCIGSDITLTPTVAPINGITYSWTTTNNALSTVSGGVVHGVSTGVNTISYNQSNVCNTTGTSATYADTVDVTPTAGTINQHNNPICSGTVQTISNTTATLGTYGSIIWSSANTSIATVASSGTIGDTTATVGGASATTASVSITATIHGCAVVDPSSSYTLTVDQAASLGTITHATGSHDICSGTSTSLQNTTAGAGISTWHVTNNSIALSSLTATSVVITANPTTVQRIDTIRYILTTGCGSDSVSYVDTVRVQPNAGVLTGPSTGTYDSVCTGSNITMVNTGSVGTTTWSSLNTGIAAVTGGVVTGVSATLSTDTTTIKLTATNTCGSASVGRYVRVKASPYAGTNPGAASSICSGGVATAVLTNTGDDNGTWTWVNEPGDNATLNVFGTTPTSTTISGFATTTAGGNPAHTAHVHYVVTNTCGSDSVSFPVTVNNIPVPTAISGPDSLCVNPTGVFTTIVESATPNQSTSGISVLWTVSNTRLTITTSTAASPATFASGTVTGLDTITYRASNACGAGTSTKVIKVLDVPEAGTIVSPDVFCNPETRQLYDTLANGDTINNSVSWDVPFGFTTLFVDMNFGVATTVDAGFATIRVTTFPGYCGVGIATKNVIVRNGGNAGTITGNGSVCVNQNDTLTVTPELGDYWYSSNPGVASVTDPLIGIVQGVAGGVTTIHYVDTVAGCLSDTANFTITVNSLSPVGFIYGQDTSCIGGTAQLFDTVSAAAGGIWTSSIPAIAAVNPTTGLVTAGAVGGTTIISYSTTNGCGANDTTRPFRVFALPNFSSTTTPAQICDSAQFVYTATSDTAGTTWSWTRPTVLGIGAAAGAGTTNLVNEYLDNTTDTGVVTATYVFTLTAHGCISNANVNVKVAPTPRLISPLFDTVCSGAPFVYVDVESTGPFNIVASWTRAAVPEITPATNSGTHNIHDTLTNSTTTNTAHNVVYVYTLGYVGCPTHTENVTVLVDPSAGTPKITTHSPADVCDEVMYQNFGAETTPAAGVTYTWTAKNAQVWATGNTRQYSLVNFTEPGSAVIYLLATAAGFNCPSADSFAVNVNTPVADRPDVTYFNGDFVCLSNDQESYQWGYDDRATLDSALFVGETNQNFYVPVPDFTTKYYFVMTKHNGCEQKSYFIVPTGVQNVTASMGDMKLYPNPASNFINVEINNTPGGKYNIEVVNLLGQKIDTKDMVNNKTTVDVADLSAGVYFINCYRDGVKFASAKFVKN